MNELFFPLPRVYFQMLLGMKLDKTGLVRRTLAGTNEAMVLLAGSEVRWLLIALEKVRNDESQRVSLREAAHMSFEALTSELVCFEESLHLFDPENLDADHAHLFAEVTSKD